MVQGEHVIAFGVTAADGAESGPVPTAFEAETLKVYAVPFVRPATLAVVDGGFPETMVGVWAVVPAYGVTVYVVMALPPSGGMVQLTCAAPSLGLAVTPVGAPGAVGADALPVNMTSTQ